MEQKPSASSPHHTGTMFTELLQAEVWRKRLEAAGYRVILEPWERPKPKYIVERERIDRGSRPTPAPPARP